MNAQEFWKACQDLHSRAIHSNCRNFSTKLFKGSSPFIQICRLLDSVPREADLAQETSEDIAEDIEDNVIYSLSTVESSIKLEYFIVFSVTYQVPVLYFQIIDIDGNINRLQFVYEHLVPKSRLDELQTIGIIGAISMANHPITDIPCFYVHPCRTAEAMQSLTTGREVSANEYLQIWIGVIGSAVGLNLPIELVV